MHSHLRKSNNIHALGTWDLEIHHINTHGNEQQYSGTQFYSHSEKTLEKLGTQFYSLHEYPEDVSEK